MRWRRPRWYDEATVQHIAGTPVDSRPHAPGYLDEPEAFAEISRNRQLMVLRLQVIVDRVIERLDDTWRHAHQHGRDSLRELAVGFVANSIGINLRDVAGMPECEAHTAAVARAIAAAEDVGDARMAEMRDPLGRHALQIFFFPTEGTRQFERVGDEMIQSAVTAYLDVLRKELGPSTRRWQRGGP